MRAEKITLELAWQLTLLSREHWQSGSTSLTIASPAQPELAIAVQAGGAWSSSAEVEPAAATLLDMLLPLCATAQDSLILAQMGQSLDGRIATDSGVSHYINGADGITHLHRLRALVDAVLVGAGTASADNPLLTVRHVQGPNPVRVILDPNRRVPAGHQLFQDHQAPTLRLVCDGRDQSGHGVTDVALDASTGNNDTHQGGQRRKLPVQAILHALARRGLRRVLVEGGGLTVSAFLEANLVDRLHLLVAPLIIGSGRPAFTFAPLTTLEGALRPQARVFALGSDTLFDLQPQLSAR